jgi:hypothetical protein
MVYHLIITKLTSSILQNRWRHTPSQVLPGYRGIVDDLLSYQGIDPYQYSEVNITGSGPG